MFFVNNTCLWVSISFGLDLLCCLQEDTYASQANSVSSQNAGKAQVQVDAANHRLHNVGPSFRRDLLCHLQEVQGSSQAKSMSSQNAGKAQVSVDAANHGLHSVSSTFCHDLLSCPQSQGITQSLIQRRLLLGAGATYSFGCMAMDLQISVVPDQSFLAKKL